MSKAPAKTILDCRRLSVFYGQRGILQDVNLKVAQGEIVTILGANGIGKTTLLRALAGLSQFPEQSTTGDIGRSVAYSFMHQQYQASLLPWYSAERNILLGLRISQHCTEKNVTDLKHLLNKLGLSNRLPLTHRPDQLSGGQRQLVTLVRTLVLNRPLLFLDEPMSSLDKSIQLDVAMHLRQIVQANGWSVVAVLHDFHLAAFLSDRCIALVGSPAKIGADLKLEENQRTTLPEFIARPTVQTAVTTLAELVYS